MSTETNGKPEKMQTAIDAVDFTYNRAIIILHDCDIPVTSSNIAYYAEIHSISDQVEALAYFIFKRLLEAIEHAQQNINNNDLPSNLFQIADKCLCKNNMIVEHLIPCIPRNPPVFSLPEEVMKELADEFLGNIIP